MKALTNLGKYLFVLPMAIFGLMHFLSADAMADMVPEWLPGGSFWVYLTGLALIASAVAVILDRHAQLALQLLGLMLLLFVLMIHLPSYMGGDEMAMVSIMKDLALCGGAWWASTQYNA